MTTVHVDATFILAAVNLEMTKANDATTELNRLASIGYLNSQMGLDKAGEVKAHLMKARDLLVRVNTPEAKATLTGIEANIAAQDMIIQRIEFSMKLKEMGLI